MTRHRWLLGFLIIVLLQCVTDHAAARVTLEGPVFYRWGGSAQDVPVARGSAPGSSWTRASRMVEVPQTGDGPLWIVVRLPPDLGPKPTLHVPRVYLWFDAWVDGRRIGGDRGPDAGGRAFHIVPLEDAHANAWLTLRIESDFSKTGVRGNLHVGTHAEHQRAMLRSDAPRLALVLVLLLGAAVALVLMIRGRDRPAYLGYATWAVGAAAWVLFYTQTRDLFGVGPRAWIVIWAAGLGLAPIGFLVFFCKLFAPNGRVLAIPLWVLVTSTLAGFGLLLLRSPASVTTPALQVHRMLIGIVVIGSVVILVRRLREGSTEARVLALGLGAYMLLSMRDVLVSLGVLQAFQTQAHWGMAAALGSGAWILGRRVVGLHRQVDRYALTIAETAQEREMMLRDLHDGLGRVTTGISMLAEVARRDRSRDEPLDTIAALAREGSHEIRTFMRGLDDTERDWLSLEAAMRERAGQLVEALQGSFELSCTISADAPPPSPYLFIHLLRVLEEGVTNALKHTTQPRIRVNLQVDGTRVHLQVDNDRWIAEAGTEPTVGVSLGAGMNNMMSRARALGGELTFERDAAAGFARLVLIIPLPIAYPDAAPP